MAVRLTLLVSLTNLLTTIVSSRMIERAGRRALLLTAQLGMAASAFFVVLATHAGLGPIFVVVALMLFVGSFGVGLGSIPWLILPELVPAYAVGPAASYCTAINWGFSFVVALILPTVIGLLGYDIFVLFGVFLLGFAALTRAFVPETKGLTPEEVALRNGFQ
ncbi:hypothetical protein HK405_013012 [Cladochytrium tenue]|nr:hypothetical protein HK405_013012 [Cladochytrium tenue]